MQGGDNADKVITVVGAGEAVKGGVVEGEVGEVAELLTAAFYRLCVTVEGIDRLAPVR